MNQPQVSGEQGQHRNELAILHDVAKALTSSLNLDSILQTIMEKVAAYFRPDNWSLLMTDEEHHELYFAIAVGIILVCGTTGIVLRKGTPRLD